MGDPIANMFWLSVAIVAVIAGTVWFVVSVWRFGKMSPRAAAKYRRRLEARQQRDGEKILQAEAQLDAEGWRP